MVDYGDDFVLDLTFFRLFGYGIGIHLLQSEEPESLPKKSEINPKDNHISFQVISFRFFFLSENMIWICNDYGCDDDEQCESMGAVEKMLKEMGIDYVRAVVEEGGIHVDQLFFHDPDGFMIEICNCDNLPVIPLSGEVSRSCSQLNCQIIQQQQQIHQLV